MTALFEDEATRAARLIDAQTKAEQLFAEIEARGVIRPGVGERAAATPSAIWPVSCSG